MKVTFQPRGYKRVPGSAAFNIEVERAVEKEASRFRVSKSFVRNVAVAEALGVKMNYDYRSLRLVRKRA